MVLHEGEPLEVIVLGWDVVEEEVGFAFEDAQDAFFLEFPGVFVDVEVGEVAAEFAVDAPCGVGLAAERPAAVAVFRDHGFEVFPSFDLDDVQV